MKISTSKWPTVLGLVLGAAGVLASYLGAHIASWATMIGVGAMLSAFGDSLMAKALPLVVFVASLQACTKAQGVAIGVAAIDATVCVLNHSQEPVDQIVKDCDGVVAEDVVKILDAHRAAEVRESAAGAK